MYSLTSGGSRIENEPHHWKVQLGPFTIIVWFWGDGSGIGNVVDSCTKVPMVMGKANGGVPPIRLFSVNCRVA